MFAKIVCAIAPIAFVEMANAIKLESTWGHYDGGDDFSSPWGVTEGWDDALTGTHYSAADDITASIQDTTNYDAVVAFVYGSKSQGSADKLDGWNAIAASFTDARTLVANIDVSEDEDRVIRDTLGIDMLPRIVIASTTDDLESFNADSDVT